MTNERPGQSPAPEPEGESGRSADSRTGGWQFTDIFAVIAAIVAIISVFVSWHILKTNFVRGAAFLGTVFLALALARLSRRHYSKELSRQNVTDMAIIGGLFICGTWVLVSVFVPTSIGTSSKPSASPTQSVKIQSPTTTGTPLLSKVACTAEVRGIAEIPAGDVVVVANKPETSPSWHFINAGPPLGGKSWSVVVHFSSPHQPYAGQVFDLVAFALKPSDIPDSAVSGNWDRSTLPSSSTVRPDVGLVQRSSNAK